MVGIAAGSCWGPAIDSRAAAATVAKGLGDIGFGEAAGETVQYRRLVVADWDLVGRHGLGVLSEPDRLRPCFG